MIYEDDFQYLNLDNISDDQFTEIQDIAMAMIETKQHSSDPVKCVIHAFFLWLGHNDMALTLVEAEDPEAPSIKH